MQNSNSAAVNALENILATMEYNESQTENFTSLTNWISKRNGKVESIVQGSTCLADSSGTKDEFSLGDQLISIYYLDETKLKQYLDHEHEQENTFILTEQEKAERLFKLKKLIGELSVDLCAVESLATLVPQWQLHEFDVPTWNHQLSPSSVNDIVHNTFYELTSVPGTKTILIQLSREEYSMAKILPIFVTAIQSAEKFILLMTSRTAQDSSCILSVVYLVDAVNKSNICNCPIDLLVLDRSFETEVIKHLEERKKTSSSEIYLWGDLHKTTLPALVSSGVLVGPSEFGTRAHFILDSLADVHTTVDSIVAEVWSSGVRVNQRTRSILFTHQPIYNRVIEFLERRMRLLNTSGDLRQQGNNFVKRPVPTAVDVQQIRNEGVKIFPHESDLSEPTLVYDVGTSCDIMASSSPNLGHVLFVISYRSNAELLSLANNYGADNEVFIHSTDVAIIKEIATNIKACKVWVNSNRCTVKKYSGNYQVLGSLDLNTEIEESTPTKTERDEFLKKVQLGEKALKVWASYTTDRRHSSVTEAFLSLITDGSSGTVADTDRFQYLSDLMRVAGRMFNEDEPSPFTLTQYKSLGVTGLVFLNPENLALKAVVIAILLSLLKGNVVLLVSVSKSVNPRFDSILNTLNSIFPLGSIHFIQSPNISHAIQLLSHPGKVSMLWLMHSGNPKPRVNQILLTSFTKVIVSHIATIEKSIIAHGQLLESDKNITL